ncbi:hypothetical protein EIN_380920 [Entamoeba invadens IP1]|uniref:Uncharacterized protein n=1 Tax=Entamoeba invadens IP1 TaxID=370355 RepID=A0A0A1UAW7_ENTIV|nr:hypothetical protein EIN_380920 [Entamoeba invadens IP1]ELP92135.1 hypothetical protein EIN_380920 [Entamoeba invadens IP1]|eukprot:XP_004258906.1 hypothetical protein EIN_380920 [Entamoeba invadens IP1]
MESSSDSGNIITTKVIGIDKANEEDNMVETPPSRSVSPVPDDHRNVKKEDLSNEKEDEEDQTSSDHIPEQNELKPQAIIHENQSFVNDKSRVGAELEYQDVKMKFEVAKIDGKILRKKNKLLNKQLDPLYTGEKERVMVALKANDALMNEIHIVYKKKRREKISRMLHLTRTD